jgi:hypothetical protein
VPPDFDQRKDVHYPLVLLLDAGYSFPIAQTIWTLGPHWRDPLSAAAASLVAPSTWLLSAGWRLAAP